MLHQTTFLVMVTLWSVLLAVSFAVPLESVEDEEDIKRSMLWSRLLGVSDRLNSQAALAEADRQMGEFALKPLTEQKRYRPPRQSRSGGMSLCLWKVCPAAPWLVTKRESNNY